MRSKFIPINSNPNILAFEHVVHRDLAELEQRIHPHWNNFSNQERSIITSLSKNKSIIIKPADKGGAIVILDKKDYLTEIKRQLSDNLSYKPLIKDPTEEFRFIIRIVVQEGLVSGYITDQIAKFLIKDYPRVPVFYILPKIHKPGFPPPGRPIVSGSNSILEPLAQYLNSFLLPAVLKSKSYISDTPDLIKKIEHIQVDQDTCLITLDVNSLYTSIPHEGARMTILDTLTSRSSQFPPTHFLMDLADIILDKN